MMILKLVSFLLVPLLFLAILWLARDDMEQRASVAVQRAAAETASAEVKRATASETSATNIAQLACSRQAVVSLAGGRAIERIASAPAPSSGRGMVSAGDLRSIVGEP